MTDLFHVVLVVHIAFAVSCAVAIWPPLLADKGGRFHRRAGWVYVLLLMLATGTSILVTAIRAVLDPAALGHEGGSPLDTMADDPLRYRLFLGFLVVIAVATAAAACFGIRTLKASGPRPCEANAYRVVALLGFLSAGVGVWIVELPMIAVGAAGGLMALFFAYRAGRVAGDEATRIRDHLTGMIASGIGTYSALAVVVGNRAAPEFFHSRWGLVVWLVPTLIGLPVILALRARVR